jgi:hypothetical protein
MISLNYFLFSILVNLRVPFYPRNPPNIPPINAPKNGIGIRISPIIIPVIVEPIAPTATAEAFPIYFIFATELLI